MVVSRSTEQKANIIFDDFMMEYRAGKSPDIDAYVSRCPQTERGRIREALAGFVFSYENYTACQLREETVKTAMDRLKQIRQRRQKFAEAQARARAEQWDQAVTQPLVQLAGLLYAGANTSESSVAIMNRAVPSMSPTTSSRLNPYARKAAEEFAQIGAEGLLSRADVDSFPVPLRAIADQLSLIVQEAPLQNLEGCLVTDGDTGGILLNSTCPQRRKRFTFAHEIGHYILHRARQTRFSDQEKELFSSSTRIEVEASAFASYLLMPPALLPAAFGRDLPNFAMADAVSADFDVSLMAVLKRLVKESNYLTIFICSEGNRVKWPDFSPEVEGYNNVVSQFPKDSAAYALFQDQAEDTYTRRMPADAWFDKGRLADGRLSLVEESRRFATGHIYTLINIEYNADY